MDWEHLKNYWILKKNSNEEFGSFQETDIVIKISKNKIYIYDNLNLGEQLK